MMGAGVPSGRDFSPDHQGEFDGGWCPPRERGARARSLPFVVAVNAALVKTRTSNENLLNTILSMIPVAAGGTEPRPKKPS